MPAGEKNDGTRIIIERRNREIFRLYQTGSTVLELIKVFHLSEDSIRKIIVKTRELTANQA